MMHSSESVPLWRQLLQTANVVNAVRSGVSGKVALEQVQSDLRPGVQALAFHVWRHLGRAEALRNLLVKKRSATLADSLLCVALALLANEAHALYDEHTLVNQAVESAKRTRSLLPQANFLNACLRRFLRERHTLIEQTDEDPVALWNHPLWWIRKIQQERPECWQEVLANANCQAPMTLRVNARRMTPDVYLKALTAHGIDASLDPCGAVILAKAVPVSRLPGFAAGEVSVQDAAAQYASLLLVKGLASNISLKVLDACAAPGGKTGHLLEQVDGQVTALELDPTRALRINDNLNRLGLQAKVLTADAAHLDAWWDGGYFDAILLDAPCTASGIVRRHPDIRWLRRETDLAQLAGQQRQLLTALWQVLKPGGRFLFCTCSLFRAEGDDQVKAFLANNTNAVLLPSPGHLMPQNGEKNRLLTDNQPNNHDGFFYALFQKNQH